MNKVRNATTSYFGTPLAKKLGIKSGFRVLMNDEPDYSRELIAPIPAEVSLHDNANEDRSTASFYRTAKGWLLRVW